MIKQILYRLISECEGDVRHHERAQDIAATDEAANYHDGVADGIRLAMARMRREIDDEAEREKMRITENELIAGR